MKNVLLGYAIVVLFMTFYWCVADIRSGGIEKLKERFFNFSDDYASVFMWIYFLSGIAALIIYFV